MERLTKCDNDGRAMMDCQKCEADWTGKHGKPMADCTALYCRNRLLDRLAEYEDTGLTPERCAEFARADAEGRYIVMRDAKQEGVARLRKLAEADKDGRLMVLPCKVGDTVYRIFNPPSREPVISAHTLMSVDYIVRWIDKFGKTVFLTREEAEAALEAMKNE